MVSTGEGEGEDRCTGWVLLTTRVSLVCRLTLLAQRGRPVLQAANMAGLPVPIRPGSGREYRDSLAADGSIPKGLVGVLVRAGTWLSAPRSPSVSFSRCDLSASPVVPKLDQQVCGRQRARGSRSWRDSGTALWGWLACEAVAWPCRAL